MSADATPWRARKAGGSYVATGWVVCEFHTLSGAPRVVFEFDAIPGMLHIFDRKQVEQEFGNPPPLVHGTQS